LFFHILSLFCHVILPDCGKIIPLAPSPLFFRSEMIYEQQPFDLTDKE